MLWITACLLAAGAILLVGLSMHAIMSGQSCTGTASAIGDLPYGFDQLLDDVPLIGPLSYDSLLARRGYSFHFFGQAEHDAVKAFIASQPEVWKWEERTDGSLLATRALAPSGEIEIVYDGDMAVHCRAPLCTNGLTMRKWRDPKKMTFTDWLLAW